MPDKNETAASTAATSPELRTEQEVEKEKKDATFIFVVRCIIVALLIPAILLAIIVFVPNNGESTVITVDTNVMDLWERGNAAEVHGTITNTGWKPAFNVTYTIVISSMYPTNDSEEPGSKRVVLGTFTSDELGIMWGHKSFDFAHTIPLSEYRDHNCDFDVDVTAKTMD